VGNFVSYGGGIVEGASFFDAFFSFIVYDKRTEVLAVVAEPRGRHSGGG
jgi:hypothetical protein